MKRVLLKLSGEALAGEKHTGFDEATCVQVAKQVKEVCDSGVQIVMDMEEEKAKYDQTMKGFDINADIN